MSYYQQLTALGIQCKDKDVQQKVNCPFCRDIRTNKNDKSLSVNVKEGVYKCHYPNCEAFMGKTVKTYERKPEYVLPNPPRLQKVSDNVVAWFEKRGISNNTLLQFKITEDKMFFPQVGAERNAICFNYYRGNDLINVKFRDGQKNFQMVKGAELIMYNLNSIEGYDWCVVTEGECFLPNAEILTEKGWMTFLEYGKNRHLKVAQYDHNGNVQFVMPLAYISKMYKGNMNLLQNNQRFHSYTTENHNLVYKVGDKIKKSVFSEIPSNAVIPRVGYHNGTGIGLSEDEIKLCIAVSADFTIRKGGDIYGSFKKERKIARVKEILDALQIPYSSSQDSRGYTSFFIRRGNAPKYLFKIFPEEWIEKSTSHEKSLIIREMEKWDGNLVSNRNQSEYSTKHYSNARFMQTIAHLSGMTATIMHRSNKHGNWFKVSILWGKSHTSMQSLKKNARVVNYNGQVNCVQVPSGMILVRQDGCISVSGNCDALALHEAQIYPVVSVPNGATKGNQNLKYLDNCIDHFEGKNKIIIFTDNDSAGISLRDELTRRLGRERVWYVNPIEGCKDANEILVTYGPEVLQQVIAEAYQIPIEGIERSEEVLDKIMDLYNTGYPTGAKISYKNFDEHISWRGAEFTMITGTPNAGKSTFLNNILVRLSAIHGWKIAMFSPEKQPTEILFAELAEIYTGETFYSPVPSNGMSKENLAKAREFINENYFFMKIDEMDVTIDGILEKAAALVQRNGVKALVIDPWNYVEHKVPKGMQETQYISEALTKVKRFKDRYQVHVFCVAHPTKIRKENGAYVVPTLYDISGSAHFFNKCDNGFVAYRDYATGLTRIYVQKIRWKFIGHVGEVEFAYILKNNRFVEIASNDSINLIEAYEQYKREESYADELF